MNFATTIHHVHQRCPGAFSLFSGRRTPHADFHLLQVTTVTLQPTTSPPLVISIARSHAL